MNPFSALDISTSGMTVEKTRLDVAAMNIANAHTLKSVDGGPYISKRVIIGEKRFERLLLGAEVVGIEDSPSPTKRVYRPEHPSAGNDGYLELPNVNPVEEILAVMEAVRAYDANVRAFNAAKAMMRSALEIGARR